MAITWGNFKDQLRRLLADVTEAKWQDEHLLDFIGWSLDTFCGHTALASATGFTADGETSIYFVPGNAFEPIDKSGAVYVDNGTTLEYLNPVRYNQRARATNGYYLMPQNQINLVQTPELDSAITVYYFAYYPHPTQDSDELLCPQWAITALLYRCAAHALSSKGWKSANIRQFGRRPDTGKPTDNVVQDQSAWFFQLYEDELCKAPRQERENYFREQ